MPQDNEYDSDSDSGSDVSVTEVQLGVGDGSLEGDDELNPLVSRMGGRAAWLPKTDLPPSSASTCEHCAQPMELLVQIFAPLTDSVYDRILLVWGCARSVCQRKNKGSVKALRMLSYNERWAAKVAKKQERRAAKEARLKAQQEAREAKESETQAMKKLNPFSNASLGGGAAGAGLGGALFGDNPFSSDSAQSEEKEREDNGTEGDDDDDDDDDDDEEDEDQMAEEMAVKASLKETIRDEDWSQSWPAYRPPQYISTYPEPSSSARAAQAPTKKEAQKAAKLVEGDGVAMKGWEQEKYESMMVEGIDDVFERFVKRVSSDGTQVVRYEFGGQPLPFNGQGPSYDLLWPREPSPSSSRRFNDAKVPPCEACGGPRIFELQLMPNLVNVLRPSIIEGGDTGDDEQPQQTATTKDDAVAKEAARKREIEEALGRKLPEKSQSDDGVVRTKPSTVDEVAEGKIPKRTGLSWSTAMVFVCRNDCHGSNEKEGAWRSEWVAVQFEE